jgi:hypothetical protein
MSKFIGIKHYVEKSFRDVPSFVIEMDDGKEYLSNKSFFEENTHDNRIKLINYRPFTIDGALNTIYDEEEHDELESAEWMDILLSSPSIDINYLVDGTYMFCGCSNLEE